MNATNAQQFQFKYTVKRASSFSFLEGQTEEDATVFSIWDQEFTLAWRHEYHFVFPLKKREKKSSHL